ncbi:hypothetical protein JXB27_03940 [Candidatus Woesearchaeota archaeon]|nr:hypothetical protein [Candidatus Woesearchaeota archaeon]
MDKLSNGNSHIEETLEKRNKEAIDRIEVLTKEILSSQLDKESRTAKEKEIIVLFKKIYDELPRESETILPRKKRIEYFEDQRKDSHAKRGVIYIPGGNIVLKILRKTALPGSAIYRNDVLTAQKFENDSNFSVAKIHDVFHEIDPHVLLRDRMSSSQELRRYHPEIQEFVPGITLSEAAIPLKKALATMGKTGAEKEELEKTIAKLRRIVLDKSISDIFYFHQNAGPLVTRANDEGDFKEIPIDIHKINERSVEDLRKSIETSFIYLVTPSNVGGHDVLQHVDEKTPVLLEDLSKQREIYGRIIDSVPDNIILKLPKRVLEDIPEKGELKPRDIDSLLEQVQGVTHVDLNGYRYGNVAEDVFNIVDSFPLKAIFFGRGEEKEILESRLNLPSKERQLYGAHRAARRANVLVDYARRLNETQETRSQYSTELKNYKKQVKHYFKRAATRLEKAVEMGADFDVYGPLLNTFENFSEFSQFIFEGKKRV